MTAHININPSDIDLAGCGHWCTEMPYRALVAVGFQQNHGTILYQVAGSDKSPRGALNAMKLALETHGGNCFYCKTAKAESVGVDMTIDHIEAEAHGANSELGNLIIACKACNVKKGHTPIDAFNPAATEEWLSGLILQAEQRLKRLKADKLA